MEFDISGLLRKKVDKLPFEVSYNLESITRDDYSLVLKSPIVIRGTASLMGQIVDVSGEISTVVEVQCSRCLETFDYSLSVDFEESFSKSSNEDYYPIIEEDLILDDMVMDNLILSMPLRLLCNDECKGLCHECGVNLNKVDCDCEKETVNPKFAALKDLFKQN